jgi:hypothetical protein
LLIGLVALTSARTSAAETVAERATRLFDEALALKDAGNVEKACERFAQSLELVAEPGTQVNVAECLERDRHYQRAWQLYAAARTAWLRAGKDKRARYAEEHAAALLAKLATLTIEIAEPSLPGLTITVGDRRVTPVGEITERADPGELEVTASAPAHRTFSARRIDAGASATIEIPPLDRSSAIPRCRHCRDRCMLGAAGSSRRSRSAPPERALVAGGIEYFQARDAFQHAGGDPQKESSAPKADIATDSASPASRSRAPWSTSMSRVTSRWSPPPVAQSRALDRGKILITSMRRPCERADPSHYSRC